MVVLDASVWVANLLDDEPKHLASRRWRYDRMSTGAGVVVPLMFGVGSAVSRRRRSAADGALAVVRIRDEPLIEIRDAGRPLWDRAIDLTPRLHLRAADALYVTLAEVLGVPHVTWDQEILDRSADAIDVRTPNQGPD